MLHLPPDRRYVCASDIHLGDGGKTEGFQKKDREFLQFIEHHKSQSIPLVIAGDCLDVLQAGNLTRIYTAHKKVIRAMRSLAKDLIYLPGNHEAEADIGDLFPRARIAKAAYIGDRIRIEHGDMYDPYGNSFNLVKAIIFLEKTTGQMLRVPLFEYNYLLNRWFHGALDKLAVFIKYLSVKLRFMGFTSVSRVLRKNARYWQLMRAGDFNSLYFILRRKLHTTKKFDTIIVGHSHLPGIVELPNGKTYVNLGSWAGRHSQYACLSPGNLLAVPTSSGQPAGRHTITDKTIIQLKDWITGREFKSENYTSLDKSFDTWLSLEYV